MIAQVRFRRVITNDLKKLTTFISVGVPLVPKLRQRFRRVCSHPQAKRHCCIYLELRGQVRAVFCTPIQYF